MVSETISLKRPPSRIELKVANQDFILRPYTVSDAVQVATAVGESVVDLKKFMAWGHFKESAQPEAQYARLSRVIYDFWSGHDFQFGIFLADSKTFVGSIGLHRRTLNSSALEIGYWIRSKYSGKGIMTAATQAMVVLCFEYLHCDRVQCGYKDANMASKKICEKVGFKFEGQIENFETAGTAEMIKNGFHPTTINVLVGLVPSMIAGLKWYQPMKKSLVVYNWLGEKVG